MAIFAHFGLLQRKNVFSIHHPFSPSLILCCGIFILFPPFHLFLLHLHHLFLLHFLFIPFLLLLFLLLLFLKYSLPPLSSPHPEFFTYFWKHGGTGEGDVYHQ